MGDVRREDIKMWNPVATEFATNTAHAEMYRRQYNMFRDLYDRNRDLMKRLG